jgi:hypothetical protein
MMNGENEMMVELWENESQIYEQFLYLWLEKSQQQPTQQK